MCHADGDDKGRKIAFLAVTRKGAELGRVLRNALGGDLFLPERYARDPDREMAYRPPLASLVEKLFPRFTHLVFIASTGIAVRCIAPLLKDKGSDPGVAVVDESGLHVISLVGGHRRDVNGLVREMAMLIGGDPVVTTASDLRGMIPLDTWMKNHGWRWRNEDQLPGILVGLLEGETVGVFQEAGEDVLSSVLSSSPVFPFLSLEEALSSTLERKVIISDRRLDLLAPKGGRGFFWAIPRSLIIGIGCRRRTSRQELEEAVSRCLLENRLCEESILAVATLDLKWSERGLLEFALSRDLDILFFSPEELEAVPAPSPPRKRTVELVGTSSVCEKAALHACGDGELVVPRTSFGRITVAVARKAFRPAGRPRGKLYLVGTGPGSEELISPRALRALSLSSTVIGYSSYLERLGKLVQGKRIIASSMGDEAKRAKTAIKLAAEGETVSLVSGGDPGVYGMASYLGELLRGEDSEGMVEVEIIPGIPAFCAAAAKLGFPISGDFAVISLSDYHLDWSLIEKRLDAAAKADMVIILYNPSSSARRKSLAEAARVIMRHRDERTPVGMARNVTRRDEELRFLELGELATLEADMNSLFIVGNSKSVITRRGMFTPRGD